MSGRKQDILLLKVKVVFYCNIINPTIASKTYDFDAYKLRQKINKIGEDYCV